MALKSRDALKSLVNQPPGEHTPPTCSMDRNRSTEAISSDTNGFVLRKIGFIDVS